MSQTKYVGKFLGRFNMQDCKPRSSPCEQKLDYTDGAEKMADVRKYREAVGSLIYLNICTRPDISFVVSKLAQYFTEPTVEQWATVKHVLRYLKGTIDKELYYRKRNETLGIHAYSDADWAASNDRRSTTGYYCKSNQMWCFNFMEDQETAHCRTVYLRGRVYSPSHYHTRVSLS